MKQLKCFNDSMELACGRSIKENYVLGPAVNKKSNSRNFIFSSIKALGAGLWEYLEEQSRKKPPITLDRISMLSPNIQMEVCRKNSQ